MKEKDFSFLFGIDIIYSLSLPRMGRERGNQSLREGTHGAALELKAHTKGK